MVRRVTTWMQARNAMVTALVSMAVSYASDHRSECRVRLPIFAAQPRSAGDNIGTQDAVKGAGDVG